MMLLVELTCTTKPPHLEFTKIHGDFFVLFDNLIQSQELCNPQLYAIMRSVCWSFSDSLTNLSALVPTITTGNPRFSFSSSSSSASCSTCSCIIIVDHVDWNSRCHDIKIRGWVRVRVNTFSGSLKPSVW